MRPTQEHLDIINSRLPGSELGFQHVEVLPFRVFDTNMTDRYTRMSMEMMRKVAKDLNEGKVAFNKLHQTNCTLPVGRSINARILDNEVQTNVYAVIQNLDGSIAEDGKELADKYNTGAMYACSAGVKVGFYECSICGNDIRNWENCEHVLGNTYIVNELPKQCTALMTGRDIVEGIAMDCGIYEVSAVTAGGVANAGILTESFTKKNSGLEERIIFETTKMEMEKERGPGMEKTDIEELINSKFAQQQEQQAALTAEKEAQQQAQFAALTAEKEAQQAQFEILAAFKEEYIQLVTLAGNKVGKTAEYATKTLEELKVLNAEYADELNALPSGRQSLSGNAEEETTYSGIPDSMYKTNY